MASSTLGRDSPILTAEELQEPINALCSWCETFDEAHKVAYHPPQERMDYVDD